MAAVADPEPNRHEKLLRAMQQRRPAPLQGRRKFLYNYSKEIAILLGLAFIAIVFLIQGR